MSISTRLRGKQSTSDSPSLLTAAITSTRSPVLTSPVGSAPASPPLTASSCPAGDTLSLFVVDVPDQNADRQFVSSSESAFKTPQRYRWNQQSSLVLVRACHALEIWAAPYGKMAHLWENIAFRVNSGTASSSSSAATRVQASGRICKSQYEAMIKEQQQQERTAQHRSGDTEEFGECEQLLLECIALTARHRHQIEQTKESEAQERAKIAATQARLQRHTMMTIGTKRDRDESPVSQTSSPASRSSASDDDDVIDQTDTRRSRRGRVQQQQLQIQQDQLAQVIASHGTMGRIADSVSNTNNKIADALTNLSNVQNAILQILQNRK